MTKLKLLHTAVVAASVLSIGAAFSGQANAASDPRLIFGVDRASDQPAIERVQVQFYIFGGRDYCWYNGGWDGPGFYWCGYAWRRGYGWGGPYGWRGWGGDREWRERHDNGWHNGWRNHDRGEWRGGDRGGWRGGDRGRGDEGGWRGGDHGRGVGDRGGDHGGGRGGGDHGHGDHGGGDRGH